jgi:hypothetical protein
MKCPRSLPLVTSSFMSCVAFEVSMAMYDLLRTLHVVYKENDGEILGDNLHQSYW